MTNVLIIKKVSGGYIMTDENDNNYVFTEINTMLESIREWYK